MVSYAASLDLSRPADVVGDFKATFVERTFSSPVPFACEWVQVRAKEAVGAIFGFEVGLAPVISAEEKDGVVVDFEFLEQLDDFSDLPVHYVHEGCINFAVFF